MSSIEMYANESNLYSAYVVAFQLQRALSTRVLMSIELEVRWGPGLRKMFPRIL